MVQLEENTYNFWSEENSPETTPMRDFYRGKVIFLTGGTGFLGQIYIEKLLRCQAKLVYVLARSKKGKSGFERLRDLFTGPLFVKLQKIDPNYMDRVQSVDGNAGELNIGLSDSIRNELIENVNIILHAAADVRFDNTLKVVTLGNLRGTREMLKLAEQCKQLDMFAYISTAFSHCDRQFIEEKFYEAPCEPEEMIEIAEYIEEHKEIEDTLDIITESFINPWPNTYSFSKALSEELMRQYGQHIPIVVIRPSIIISTYEDPIPAWCNNIYGLNGMLVAAAQGFLRIMIYKSDARGDVICADFVTNSTLAAIWDRRNELDAMEREITSGKMDKKVLESKIYNVTSKQDKPNWSHISETMRKASVEYPTTKNIWCIRSNQTNNRIMEFFLVIFYHAIPGLLFDLVLKFNKQKLRLSPLYRKSQLFMMKLRYFMTREWQFSNENMFAVYDRMNKYDKLYFPCDTRKFDWDSYCHNYNLGLLRYIGHDTLENFDAARKRYKKFTIAHFFVLVLYYSFLALVYFFLGRLFGINQLISAKMDKLITCFNEVFFNVQENV